jgi:hypothetical protein
VTQPKISPLSWTPARDVLDHEAHDFTPWPETVAVQAAQILGAWSGPLQDHPLIGIAEQIDLA